MLGRFSVFLPYVFGVAALLYVHYRAGYVSCFAFQLNLIYFFAIVLVHLAYPCRFCILLLYID